MITGFKHLNKALTKMADDTVDAARRNIGATRRVNGKSRKADTTGRTRKSLGYEMKNKRLIFGSSLSGLGPVTLEYGRRAGAKPPPSSVVREWMDRKRIRLRNEKGFVKETENARNALAFIIARSIGKKGTEGLHYFNDALASEFKKHEKLLADAIEKDLEIGLEL